MAAANLPIPQRGPRLRVFQYSSHFEKDEIRSNSSTTQRINSNVIRSLSNKMLGYMC